MEAIEKGWIDLGYRTFAHEGPTGLKVERLAKAVGKSKSSFYHLFADLEVFTERLVQFHLAQAKHIAVLEAACTSLEDLIEVIVDHKTDLLFNRQLKIHRDNPTFSACFAETNAITTQAILGIWAQILGLGDNSYLAGLVLKLSLENFYLQITDETLNEAWLRGYFEELQATVRAFKQMGTIPALDGTV